MAGLLINYEGLGRNFKKMDPMKDDPYVLLRYQGVVKPSTLETINFCFQKNVWLFKWTPDSDRVAGNRYNAPLHSSYTLSNNSSRNNR